ncbi:MAG TPA: transposase [Acidimicrobiales bacterium]|nr:transposase [Acidimicrobiales bacterium]
MYVTGRVDLQAKVVIDMVEGNAAADLRRWSAKADAGWLGGIEVVATDLAESFRAGLSPHLDHARRVADPFHVVRAGNRCLDKVRRRVQNETLRHRAASEILSIASASCCSRATSASMTSATGACCLACGWAIPSTRCWGRWLAKESVRDVYLAEYPAEAALLLDKAIAGCADDEVEEVRSLGNTLARWRTEILAHHDTGASNGPTEGLNLCVKKVKRCGHGFRTFEHYRLRVLLHAGGVTWPSRPRPPRIRTRIPTQTRRATNGVLAVIALATGVLAARLLGAEGRGHLDEFRPPWSTPRR